MIDVPRLLGFARLRWLLVLIVLVAVTPVFAIQLYRLETSSEAALAEARSRAVALARDGASDYFEVLEKAQRMLELLRGLPAVRYATAECTQILMGIQGINPWITTILVANPDGKVLCHGRPGLSTPYSIADRAHFQSAMLTRNFATSDVLVGKFVQRPLIAAALPALDTRGSVESVISLGIDLEWIHRIAARASAKFGGVVIAVDRRGTIIAQQPQLIPNTEQASENPLVRKILTADTSSLETRDPGGEQRIFGIARLPEFGVAIAVGLRRNEVLEVIDRRFWNDLTLLSLVAAGSIAAAMLFAEFGVLRGVRVPAFVAGELHDLAATYNAMTAEFERLAYLDRLTGLPNRRYLERQLAERAANGHDRAEAVLAIDLDGFKPVNDTHGHAVGDRVLTAVARRIASVVDERGLLARVGGDEFVAVIPLKQGQSRETARAVAEEIRRSLDAEPVELDGLKFPVGCSVGVAVVPEDAKSLAGAIVVADAALYEAKRAGRNCVVDNAPPLAVDDPTGSIPAMARSGVARPRPDADPQRSGPKLEWML
jgi:diguanylate cyclase (GGDEF)-like protein